MERRRWRLVAAGRGVQQEYIDPSVSGNVSLPASYDRVFSRGKGDYVLTNDVSFDPGTDWSSISRVR